MTFILTHCNSCFQKEIYKEKCPHRFYSIDNALFYSNKKLVNDRRLQNNESEQMKVYIYHRVLNITFDLN